MQKKDNLTLIGITVVLYIINQLIKTRIPVGVIRWVMSCYFNDTIGGITFIAYCNIVFSFYNRKMTNLLWIELLMLFAGLFWEYITPIFRANTVSDIWDVVAYMNGGFLYWLIIKKKHYGD